ncbi:ubiquitin-conjugating enzyme E2Q-like protein 1 [Ceratitis capitata]|uniref:E2 ubiquitin-conjugating enzyme n=1 Tax=Ceratitis capitata TaxID=7213 RepID=W8C2G3_CERCA|nr:ubiquitin-conjugating enzyme E2Q-like protein 1 [Ceratitis capitata]XP_012159106.1 ubiquitin-conjugating enzyme E2Q-like protein 1 [Ceratitis capitata]XP_020715640.1 ubiquitin-conjugating enzyme E2Q-like protein 1 [Ceratitis capitata]
MSSRLKEKVSAAIRKFNKSRSRSGSGDKAGDAGGGGATSANNANSNAGGNVLVKNSNEVVAAESPGKRMRRQDNKVSPATSRMVMPVNVQHAPDHSIRARRLMKEYKEIQKVHNGQKDPVFTVELINDNLYEWYARLHIVDPDSKLAKDMTEMNIPFILLHLVFPDNFPFAPPFMRVVEPRIEKGFVMEGGAICMELLTPRGWASAYTVEAVLMQFAASLVKGQGRIVRKTKSSKEFSRRTAEEAFRSLVKTHEKYGWVTPALSDG